MKAFHKNIAYLIFIINSAIFFLLDVNITSAMSQNLVTFFSIVFGFYITSVAVIYSSEYTKSLYRSIDETGTKRDIHILKSYLLNSGYISIASILLIIIFTLFSSPNESNKLVFNYNLLHLDLSLGLVSAILGFCSVNIFFMIIVLKTILNGMVFESKDSK